MSDSSVDLGLSCSGGTISSLPANLLGDIFELLGIELAALLKDHECFIQRPCTGATEEVPPAATFPRLKLVCKAWKTQFVKTEGNLDRLLYKFKWGLRSRLSNGIEFKTTILSSVIEDDGDVTVFNGYDLGSPRDCRKKRPVVLKSFRRTTGVFERSVYLEYLQEELSLPLCGFAQLLDHGYQERLRYIVLEKLGSSLQHVLDISPEKRFNEQMTLSLAIQSLKRRYRDLHSHGILHNGAKPANFCISPDPSRNQESDETILYMIDFDLSESVKHEDSLQCTCTRLLGNPIFSSISTGIGLTHSYRDDLEALLYTLVYLFKGKLPWQSDSWHGRRWQRKAQLSSAKLCEGMDPVFSSFLDRVKLLPWGERPDYLGMIAMFSECWVRKGYGDVVGAFKWWEYYNSLTTTEDVSMEEGTAMHSATTRSSSSSTDSASKALNGDPTAAMTGDAVEIPVVRAQASLEVDSELLQSSLETSPGKRPRSVEAPDPSIILGAGHKVSCSSILLDVDENIFPRVKPTHATPAEPPVYHILV